MSRTGVLTLGLLCLFFLVSLKVLLDGSQLSLLGVRMQDIVSREVPEERLIGELRNLAAQLKTSVQLTVIDVGTGEENGERDKIERRTQAVVSAFKGLYPGQMPADESAIVAELERLISALDGCSTRIASLWKAGETDGALALFVGPWETLHQSLLATLNRLAEHEAYGFASTVSDTEQFIRSSRNTSVVLALFGMTISIALASVVVVYLTRPVEALRMAIERVKRGDPVLKAEYERVAGISPLTRDFSEMLDQLHRSFEDACHEFRAPLTVVRGEAETALRVSGERVSEYRDALENIVAAAEHLGRLVEDVMFLSRSDVGQVPYEMHRVDLFDVMNHALRQCKVLAAAKGVEVVFDAQCREGGVSSVRGDAGRLCQLFVILLDNGIKYNQFGGSLGVRLGWRGDSISAVIQDSGVGIEAEDLPLICQRFYRGATARLDNVTGSGLGLAIARSIVHAHAGSLDVDSEPGVGTRIEVTVPTLRSACAS